MWYNTAMEKKNIEYIEKKLKKYGAEIYNYRGTEFIGIKNPYSDNNLVITFGENENVMEFTFQSARFLKVDLDGIVCHAEKFLKNELCAAEFFLSGKSLFGGSRNTVGSDFKNLDELLIWYTAGNEKIAENLRGFCKNGGVSLKIFTWNGKADRAVKISADGKISG